MKQGKDEILLTTTATASTAFPKLQPGKADSPGPIKVPAHELRRLLGITDVSLVQGRDALAIMDSNLG